MAWFSSSSDRTSVSVAMATYNGARYLPEMLASVAGQSRLPDELVVRDDGSEDGTVALLEDFARQAAFPVRILERGTRLGYAQNFMAVSSAQNEGAIVAPSSSASEKSWKSASASPRRA